MKITLFMCAGVIIVRTHRSNISEMYGIGKKMPITMLLLYDRLAGYCRDAVSGRLYQ